ncbi:Gfo/Idh/MocA family oxidoreductase [Neobacillus pocheonensis]|uniref:Gfo/Idh/MocA family protein n=1 Tax=Neobacillus pocheonensis TaxID=363869 RepID=UPI003D2A0985
MTKQKTLKIVQVGIGAWGYSWIKVIQESSEWELAGIVDLNSALLEKACAEYGVDPNTTFTSLSEAIEKLDADAVLVTTPPEYHAPVVNEALEKGLNCIVEKPLADTVEAAKSMVETAERTGKKLMISQNYRFKRAPRTVKEVLKSGVVGEVGNVFINFHKAPVFEGYRSEMDEPLLTDMAIHHFDQIRSILGVEPVSVTATSWNPKWSWFKGNAVTQVRFDMSNGSKIIYNGNWVSTGSTTTWDGDWNIQGDGGEVYWSNNKVVVRTNDLYKTVFMKGAVEVNGELHYDLVNLPSEERLGSLYEFASAIKEDRQPETSGADNMNSIAMVLGALLSVKTGRTVTIDEVLGKPALTTV